MRGDGLIPGGGRYSRTPDSLRKFHISVIGRTLVECGGNISEAAEKLGVPTRDLRRMSRFRRELVELIDEIEECRLDRAEARLHEAIGGKDLPLAARMSAWLLAHHERGRARGYLSSSSPSAVGAVTLTVAMPHYTWADGSELPQRHTVPPAIPAADEASIDEPLIDDSRDEESEIASAPPTDEPPADDGPADEMPPDEQPADEPFGLE
jgi:hypothetical protein